jgi:hypothetical protein
MYAEACQKQEPQQQLSTTIVISNHTHFILRTTFRKFQGSLKESDLPPRVALAFHPISILGYGNWSS